MKLSRTVSYALHAAMQLAQSEAGDAPVPCSRLAAEGKMPERFLLQILRNLVAHGILESTRGIEGGYSLRKSPREISLLDLIEAVGGPVASKLPIFDGFPAESKLMLQRTLTDVDQYTRRAFGAVKLSHLLSAAEKRAADGDGHPS